MFESYQELEVAMKPHALALVTAGLMICTVAAAQNSTTTTTTGKSRVTKPAEFAKMAAVANMFEIKSSELALEAANKDSTKEFAQHMIADHTKAGEDIVPAAKAEKVQLPTSLDKEHQAKLNELKSADQADFDKKYLAEQLKAHETAVALFSVYSSSGQKGELKTFAAKTLPTLNQHLADVKKLN
jgi:putative membrane protein